MKPHRWPVQAVSGDLVQLAIETTGRLGSIAVLKGQRVLSAINLDPPQRTAAALFPELERTLRWCGQCGHRPDFISIADGPGSFTGIRIGVTTAKMLGYSLGVPIVNVDSLAAIAASVFHDHPSVPAVLVALDAYRGQTYCGTFDRSSLLPSLEEITDQWVAHPATVGVLAETVWNSRLELEFPEPPKMAAETGSIAIAGDRRSFRGCTEPLLTV